MPSRLRPSSCRVSRSIWRYAFLALATVLGGCAENLTEPSYAVLRLREIVALGSLVDSAGVPHGTLWPRAVNFHGQVVGNGWDGVPLAIWEDGEITILSNARAIGTDINVSGQVGGYLTRAGQYNSGTPFIAGEDGFSLIPVQFPATVEGLTDTGVLVGTEMNGSEPLRAYVWADGASRFIEVPGAPTTQAVAANNEGTVLVEGRSRTCSDAYEYGECWLVTLPAVVQGDKIVKLGRLPWRGVPPGERVLGELGHLDAADMNDQGDVVGADREVACTGDRYNLRCHQHERAFLRKNGSMINLGTLPGFDNSQAIAVNNRRQVVGRVSVAGQWGASEYFLYHDGRIYDVGEAAAELGWTLLGVTDINDHGQIIGTGNPPGSDAISGLLLVPDL